MTSRERGLQSADDGGLPDAERAMLKRVRGR